MTSFRLLLPQQKTTYTGKVESIPERTSGVFRILLPTRITSYAGKAETTVVGDTGPMNGIMQAIMQNIMSDIDECDKGECK